MLDSVLGGLKPAEIVAEIREFRDTSYQFMLWMKKHVEAIEKRLDALEKDVNESSRV
jgi:hypothetical protein